MCVIKYAHLLCKLCKNKVLNKRFKCVGETTIGAHSVVPGTEEKLHSLSGSETSVIAI